MPKSKSVRKKPVNKNPQKRFFDKYLVEFQTQTVEQRNETLKLFNKNTLMLQQFQTLSSMLLLGLKHQPLMELAELVFTKTTLDEIPVLDTETEKELLGHLFRTNALSNFYLNNATKSFKVYFDKIDSYIKQTTKKNILAYLEEHGKEETKMWLEETKVEISALNFSLLELASGNIECLDTMNNFVLYLGSEKIKSYYDKINTALVYYINTPKYKTMAERHKNNETLTDEDKRYLISHIHQEVAKYFDGYFRDNHPELFEEAQEMIVKSELEAGRPNPFLTEEEVGEVENVEPVDGEIVAEEAILPHSGEEINNESTVAE